MRVRIALAEKGLEYENRQENLGNKSPLLLQMNPVYKKIPVLIHDGKPICESLVILQYIDEVWSGKNQLMPSDPYSRAQARFWADFIDKKIFVSSVKIWNTKGEDQEASKKDFMEALKTLQGQMGDKPYFGGQELGFLDLVLISYSPWFYTFETFGNFKIETECPKIAEWMKRCAQRESVSKNLADPQKIYEFVLFRRKQKGLE